MLYLLASAAVWMLFGSDTLSVDARLYTNLVVLSACLHSFWLLVTLSRQQMAAWYATTECGAGLSCVAAKGQGPTAQTPVVLKVSEDSDVHSNNMLGWAEFLHPPPQSTDRPEWGGWGIYGGTAKWWFGSWHRQGHVGDRSRRSILSINEFPFTVKTAVECLGQGKESDGGVKGQVQRGSESLMTFSK